MHISLTFAADDGTVVVMTSDEYLCGTPFYGHQVLVLRVARLLEDQTLNDGHVIIAPIDAPAPRLTAIALLVS